MNVEHPNTQTFVYLLGSEGAVQILPPHPVEQLLLFLSEWLALLFDGTVKLFINMLSNTDSSEYSCLLTACLTVWELKTGTI